MFFSNIYISFITLLDYYFFGESILQLATALRNSLAAFFPLLYDYTFLNMVYLFRVMRKGDSITQLKDSNYLTLILSIFPN